MKNLKIGVSLIAQPTVNGDLSDPEYSQVAVKQNANMGFGPDIDVTEIVYHSDATNKILYVGVLGRLNNASNDGIGLMLNLTTGNAPIGIPACNPLGWALDLFGNTPGHYMSANGGANPFFADFEVDLLFALNPGVSATNCYLDFTSTIGGLPVSAYLGDCGQAGTPQSVIEPNTGLAIDFAFQNGGGNNGFEMAIDYSATPFMPEDMEAFAFVVSATAFFSDVTVPGNITTGNPGFGVDFCALTTSGPFHSGIVPVPVELIYFEGEDKSNAVDLYWATAQEYNSAYFEVQRSRDSEDWETIGKLEAAGESQQRINYQFTDTNPHFDQSYYRLKQIDLDGTAAYSDLISIRRKAKPAMAILYPNPVQEEVFVELEAPALIQVFDASGRVIRVKKAGAGVSSLSLNGWNPGMYWVQAVSETGVQVLREIMVVE
ncbi:MAG: T9SS type A sorting domain-containing protein [Bacteroidetes bacterium]|nr:T9SS type A sorting domain-containing protein [Bacteroidota bacterium]